MINVARLVVLASLLLSVDAQKCASNVVTTQCSSIPGFTNVGGSCYAGVYVAGNIDAARAACKKLHPQADLATIRCATENQGVAKIGADSFRAKCMTFGSDYFTKQLLIGLKTGKWLSGSPATYRSWWNGEPNGQGQETVTAMYIIDQGNTGSWNDHSPQLSYCGAVCEVITPTSGQSCGDKPCLVAPSSPCPSDWSYGSAFGSCYKAFSQAGGFNFDAGNAKCQAEGGQLASIHSQTENDFVSSVTNQNKPIGGSQTLIGGQRTGSGATNWKWSDGSAWDFTAWSSSNPDNSGGSQNCIQLLASPYGPGQPNWYQTNKWDDLQCTSGFQNIVCKKKVAVSSPCPSGWSTIDGLNSCYQVVTQAGGLSFDNGNSLCQAAGGQLASVHSAAENTFIMSLANTPNGNAGGQTLIGGQRTGPGATNWKWSDGSAWDFTAWSSSNPDNAGGSQNCIHALASPYGSSPPGWFVQGRWDDAGCNAFANAVCKRPRDTGSSSSSSSSSLVNANVNNLVDVNLIPATDPLLTVDLNLLCFLNVAPVVGNSCAGIPGFTDVGGSCYATIFVGGNSDAARAACKKLHPKADLGTIRCAAENQGVYALGSGALKSKCSSFAKDGNFYANQMSIGLKMNQWESGTKTTYRNWNAGEPNGGANEPRGTMFIVDNDKSPAGTWNDANETPQCATLCEVIVATSGKACKMRPCSLVDLNVQVAKLAALDIKL